MASSAAFANPILSIQPPQAAEPPGGTFSLDVNIQEATDVFAFQFDLTFAPDILEATGVTEGSFLSSAGRNTFFIPGTIGFRFTTSEGTIRGVADTLLGSGPGASGDGTLAIVNFTVIGTGTSDVALSNVQLLDSSLHTIASTTAPSTVTITPEPMTCALAGFALLGMLVLYRSKWRARIWAIGLLVPAVLAPAQAAAPGYKFTLLAQTGEIIAGKTLTSVGTPAINNAGTVVFLGSFSGGSGIFTPSELLVKTGDTIGGRRLTGFSGSGFPGYDWTLAISDAGAVFFLGSFSGSLGIFTPSELLVQPGDTIAGKTIIDFFSPPAEGSFFSINREGKLVFAATFKPYAPRPSLGGQGIFTLSELVAQAGDPSLAEYYSPVINDVGMVVFGCSLGGGISNNICLPPGQVSPPGQVLDCSYESAFPAINDASSVVSYFQGAEGSLSGICPVASAYYGLSGSTIGGKKLLGVSPVAPAINNPGTVVFIAGFEVPSPPPAPPGQAFGLFTSTELLLTSGDMVGGKTVASNAYSFPAFFSQHAINDAGAIVFETTFTYGSSGIVLATPISSGIAGDVNGDGVVDCTDLALIKALFGRTFGQAGFDPRADTNGDGIIDVRDLAFVAQHLPGGTSCPDT